MAYKRQRDFETCVEYLGLTRNEATLIFDRASEICALKSPASDKHLHKITSVAESDEWVKDLIYPHHTAGRGARVGRRIRAEDWKIHREQ